MSIFESISALVVDDHRDMRLNLRGTLESLYVPKVYEAKSGDDALELLQRHSVDIVLCDYNMGDGRNGQQTLEEARSRKLLKPGGGWIMVTAEQAPELVMGVLENGPDDYLIKPIGKPLLQQRLERVLMRKRLIAPIAGCLASLDFRGAIRACDALLARLPAMRSDVLRLKVRALLELDANDEAAEVCFGALADHEYPWALVALGRARHALGSKRDARRFLAQAIQKYPMVMEAYDLLARVEQEDGNYAEAKRLLLRALEISPLSVTRLQLLGDYATQNGDHVEAERAYHRAVRLGEDSCLARAEDPACLVTATLKSKGPQAALAVVQEIAKRNGRRRSVQGPDWRLLTAQARISNSLGRQAEAAAALTEALAAYRRDVGHDNAAHSLELVRCCYELGRGDEAKHVVRKLVRENFDRAAQLDLIRSMFEEVGALDEGAKLIEEERKAVIKSNNDGVLLAREGRFEEGLALLQQAADEMPNNPTVILNVVLATLIHMRSNGVSQQVKYIAHEYLDRARKLAPRSPQVAQLGERLRAMEAGAALASGA